MKTGKQVKTLTGYKKGSKPLTFSPDGKKLANDLGIWDIKTGKYTGINEEHVSTGTSIKFIQDGRTFTSWGWEGFGDIPPMQLWDVKAGKPVATFKGRIFALSVDGKTMACGIRKANHLASIQLWDVKTHEQKLTISTNHRDTIRGLLFSPDGKTIGKQRSKRRRNTDY